MMKRIFIILFMLHAILVNAQGNYADKEFYLIDSLEFDKLSEFDKNLLDSVLTQYHSFENDTDQLQAISHLSNTMYSDEWIKYNNFLKEMSWLKLRSINTSKEEVVVYKRLLAGSLNNYGISIDDKGMLEEQINIFSSALKIYRELGDSVGASNALNSLGLTYKNMGDIESAINCYFKSLRINEQQGDRSSVASNYVNIGSLYKTQKDYENSLEYYQKAEAIYNDLTNEKRALGILLSNLGALYRELEKYELAEVQYNKAIEIQTAIGHKSGLAYSLSNLGYIFKVKGDFEKAKEYYDKSLLIRTELGDKSGMSYTYNNIAVLLLENGDIKGAKENALSSFDHAVEAKYPINIQKSSGTLTKVYKAVKDWDNALKYYETYISYRDSLKNEETQKATIRQQTKYEFEKAQLVKEQAQQEQQRKEQVELTRRNNLQFSGIFVFVLLLFVFVFMSGRFHLSQRVAEGLIFFTFLLFFEFCLVLMDPFIENWSKGEPLFKLLFNAILAGAIFPAHAFFENTLKKRLLKKS